MFRGTITAVRTVWTAENVADAAEKSHGRVIRHCRYSLVFFWQDIEEMGLFVQRKRSQSEEYQGRA